MKTEEHAVVERDGIDAVRQFNRFHTRLVGALNNRLLTSDYSLPQVRVLYEIARAPTGAPISARELGDMLRLDAGYLSRLIAKLESDGLLERQPNPANAKRLDLRLTQHGEAVFAALDQSAVDEVEALLAPLTVDERQDLVRAMAQVRRLLGDDTQEHSIILREPEAGDLGWITYMNARIYAREYGWDWTYEALVAEIVGKFVKEFDTEKEKCWVAELGGQVVGSVMVVREDDETAKLRLLWVDAAARGRGLGRRLVDECISFARARGYKRMVLWTNDVLASARRIYQAVGFELVEEKAHRSFGKDLVGQVWARDL